MLNIKTQNNVFICLQIIFQLQNLWKEIPHPPPVFYFSPLLLWGGILTSKCNTVVPLIFFFLPRLHATSGDTAEDLHYHLHNNASNHKGEQLAFIFEMLLKQSSAVPYLIHLYCSNTSTTWHIDVTSWNLWWYESNPVEIGSFFSQYFVFCFPLKPMELERCLQSVFTLNPFLIHVNILDLAYLISNGFFSALVLLIRLHQWHSS